MNCPPSAKPGAGSHFSYGWFIPVLRMLQKDCHSYGPDGLGDVELVFSGDGSFLEATLTGYSPVIERCMRAKLATTTIPTFNLRCVHYHTKLDVSL